MTVSQCSTQSLPVAAEAAAVTSGSGQTGLFNSIFAGIFESGDPAMPEPTGDGENGQADVMTDNDTVGDGAECKTTQARKVKGGFVMGMRMNPNMKEAPEIGDAAIAATMNWPPKEPGRNILDASTGTPGSDKSSEGKGKSPDEEIATEKSTENISESVVMSTAVLQTTGIGVSLGAQGTVNGQPTMSQVQMPDAKCPVPDSGIITNPDESIANSSETTHAKTQRVYTILQTRKNSDLQHVKQQLFEIASTERTGGKEQVPATGKDDERNLSGVRIQHQGKQDQNALQTSVTAGANDPAQALRSEKSMPAGKGVDFEKIEAPFGDSSPAGEFSEKSGESSMNAADNVKGNLKLADLNPGMRSTDGSAQTSSPTQNAASEPSRPPSHEEIVSQVREKLAEHRLNGDSSRITIRLHPEHLGNLQIEMKMENHRLKVEIIAENQNVKEALVQHMDTLKDTLSRQNIAMERFNVLTGGGGGSGGSYRDWRQTGQNAQPNPFMRYSGFSEDTPQSNISYLDSSENSMVDLRL
jgi:flagellar hook-length control protein FliK